MHADVYYWKDEHGDRKYQPNEKSDYFSSTGGKYHQAAGNLRQQSYLVFDMPMFFRYGHHEFAWLNTYALYYNNVTTRLDRPADQYGTYQTNAEGEQIFYFNKGAVNYVVDYYPASYMKTDKFYDITVNTPYFAATTFKYTYHTEKFLCSFSWCCNLMNGVSALGNGPLSNSLGIYSETSANPNTQNYKLLGRLDQDRSYIGRILMSYKLSKRLSLGMSGKFKDGVPFTSFNTQLKADESGNAQLAMWNARTKGTNSINEDFGTRKDAFFNIDLRAVYNGNVMRHPYEIQMMLYNVYDFGTEITEYNFEPDIRNARYALELNIPRGLMVTAKIGL
jgi:hypothetical protein